MARKAKAKSKVKRRVKAARPKVKATPSKIDERGLTKGEVRKLNSLRKSVGEELGEQTFTKWLRSSRAGKSGEPVDKNAALIAEALSELISNQNLRIPRGGYLVTRGRGRVVVTRTQNN